MFRGSIAALMGVVALVGLGIAALRNPTEWAAAATYSGVLAALLAGVFFTAISLGHRRRFWAMFTVCGVVHLGSTFVTWPGLQPITANLVEWAYERSNVHPARAFLRPNPMSLSTGVVGDANELLRVRTSNVATYSSVMPLNLFRIGIHLATLAVALVGGGLAALVPLAPRPDAGRGANAS